MALHSTAFGCFTGSVSSYPTNSSNNFSLTYSTIKLPSFVSLPRLNFKVKAFSGDGVSETKESSLVVCFGEMLIDFVPTINGLALAEAPAFKKAPGGAPANVAVGIARLGGSSAFIGKAKIFHYGSISLITEPCKSAHIAAAKAAKDAGVVLSYDPNLRLPLWPSAEKAREGILSIWETADIIKISEEEITFLTNGEDPNNDEVVRKLFHPNLKLLLVTEGPDGCRYYTKDFSGKVQGLKVDVVDTTGAGDAFVAGTLSQLAVDLSLLEKEEQLRDALRFANACGALTVMERGAIPALPTREAVLNAIFKSVS